MATGISHLARDPRRPAWLSLIYADRTATRFATDRTRDDVGAVPVEAGLVIR